MELKIYTDAGQSLSLEARPDDELAQALWVYGGLPAPSLCAGLGQCGACRVRLLPPEQEELTVPAAVAFVPDEEAILGRQAIDAGWRLACRHTVRDIPSGWGVQVLPRRQQGQGPVMPTAQTGQTGQTGWVGHSEGIRGESLRLAVDLGTTSVHWLAMDEQGVTVAQGQAPNAQSGAGSDVVSRLALAAHADGRQRLSCLARQQLRDIMNTVLAQAGDGAHISALCVAANTAMSALLLDVPVTGLLGAPYSCPVQGGEWVQLDDTACAPVLGSPAIGAGRPATPFPPLWLPPQPAPFVGGDVAAGMIWAMAELPVAYPFLFADMGTNGECVLAVDAHTSCITSVPLGPALEGIGLSCGGLAGPGSVTRFALGPQGLVPQVWGGGAPVSLCGAGVLSLLHVLRRAGVLTAEGQPAPVQTPLARRLWLGSTTGDRGGIGSVWRLPLPGGLWLTAHDVEAVLKVRAAFRVALEQLLRAAEIRAQDLSGLLLAGSLGEHAPLDALEQLGFVPQGVRGRVHAVGNAALTGAALLLREPEQRERALHWSAACRLVDVTGQPEFMAEFAASMRLEG